MIAAKLDYLEAILLRSQLDFQSAKVVELLPDNQSECRRTSEGDKCRPAENLVGAALVEAQL